MLARRTPLVRKTPLVAKKPLVSRTPLKAKTPLKSKVTLKAKLSLKQTPMPKRAKKKSGKNGPERSEAFMEFVRAQPCLIEGCREPSQAHHSGSHGMGTKASDFSCVPLCHYHHIECWHRTGTLPGATHEQCVAVFYAVAERLVREFHGAVSV